MTCGCGCGEPTQVAKRNRYDLGHVKGEPIPFISGHNARLKAKSRTWLEEDRGHDTPCWIWQGYIDAQTGYGKATVEGGMAGAHRVVYLEAGREIPDGLTLDHLCRVRECVNPDHLEPVTQRENVIRGFAARRELAHAA